MPSSPALSGASSPSASAASSYLSSIREDPASYDVLLSRLRSLATATTPAWSAADINLTSTMAIGDFDHNTLTRRQLTAVSTAIHDVWPTYPTFNLHRTTGGLTRLSLLQLYLVGELEQIVAFGARPPPPLSTPPAVTPPPPPPPPLTPAPAPASSKTPPSRFSAPPPPHIAARPAAAPSYPPSATYTSGAVRAVAQSYTPHRQYGGLGDESLPRARATFTCVCEALSVPPPQRAVGLPFTLRLTEHNLPTLAPSVSASIASRSLTALSPPSPTTPPSLVLTA